MEEEKKEIDWLGNLSQFQKEKEATAKESLEKIAMAIQSDVSDDFKVIVINGLTNNALQRMKQINAYFGA